MKIRFAELNEPRVLRERSHKHIITMRLLLFLLTAFLYVPSTTAQWASPAAVTSTFLYQGADRQQRLINGAKKEGKLMLYTSLNVDDAAALTTAFEQKYGIKTIVWRSSNEKLLQRTLAEARNGRHDVDILETDGLTLESLHREQLLQQIWSPYFPDLLPQAVQSHREWVGTRISMFVQAYHTDKVQQTELPKTYEDLLDPKWKGRLGIEADDFDWFAAAVQELGTERGLKLFGGIVAANGLSVRKGHTLLANLVASGDVPLALTVFNYKIEQLKRKGAPVEWFAISPAIARPNGAAVLRKAPHPHAAVLFYDFLISDGQQIMFKRDFVPASNKIDAKLNKIPLKFMDLPMLLDENDKWNKLYNDIVVKQGK
jgi:iron(III) transport system substrate-binding protein